MTTKVLPPRTVCRVCRRYVDTPITGARPEFCYDCEMTYGIHCHLAARDHAWLPNQVKCLFSASSFLRPYLP